MDNIREIAQENIAPSSDIKIHEIQPESRHECSICLNWLQDPHLTTCGHRFCKNCITSWLQHKDFCPIDNVPINSDTDLFPDNFTKREIMEHRTVCPFAINGCMAQVIPMEMDSHIATCEFKNSNNRTSLRSKVACSFKDLGCEAILKNEEVLTNHLETHLQEHLRLLISAYSKIMLNKNINEATSNKDVEVEATCLWEPGDKQTGSDESTPPSTGTSGITHQFELLIRTLYEKVVILEQRNREQDITIGNLSRLVMATKTNQQRLSEDIALKYCMGSYIWKLDNFNSKLNMMINDPSRNFYSQGFYTSPLGYRFCARLNLSATRARCLALHIHLMKTEHDDALKWPFIGRITLNLVNLSFPQLSVKDTMMSKPDIGAFQRPTSDICIRGFGYSEYVTIDDVKYKGFMKSDVLLIKIEVVQV